MIHVEYEKKNNYPHDKGLVMFDRDAFQSLGDAGLCKVNEKYNILCPQVFVMECLSPNRASEEQKRWLFRRLQLIENPIVLTGDTNTSGLIEIPLDLYYSTFLTSEQIAKNCITKTPIAMEGVTPEKLIAHYESKIDAFKDYVKEQTERCEKGKGYLTLNQIISRAQDYNPTWSREKIKAAMKRNEDTHVKENLSFLVMMILKATEEEPISDNINRLSRLLSLIDKEIRILQSQIPTWSREKIKAAMKRNEDTHVKENLSFLVMMILKATEEEPISDNINRLSRLLSLIDKEIRILQSQIQEGKTLTVENYPDLAYPLYIFCLFRYITNGRQFNTQHLDQSYVCDFRYLHYLNFCDIFITNETSTPYIVKSIPYNKIRETPVITVEELKRRLN